jgi:RNA polymerase sigma-70 factor (ECF subfamily)
LTEFELIAQLKLGNENAFKTMVFQYQNKVYNTALGLLQNNNDAEDIAQEVFIQVYKSIQQFKGEAAFSTWVYRITITKCLDFLRSKKRKKRFGVLLNLFSNNTPIYDAAHFNHPGVLLDNKEKAALLFACIQQLPQNQKTAFILNKVEDLSYNEIALILKISVSAVDALLQRAKQNLRKIIDKKND